MTAAPEQTPSPTYGPDVLGDGYSAHTIDLGADPDGETSIVATLVRRDPPPEPKVAVLWVHGFTDYFFQTEVADHFTARGYSFYALDLRKCGRSLRAGQSAHFISNLALYDTELNTAISIIASEVPAGTPILLAAHSTGGLIVPLWLDRTRRAGIDTPVAGAVFDSPWFELQGPAARRIVGTPLIAALGKVAPTTALPIPGLDSYGASIYKEAHGEWDFNLAWKPLAGFPIRFGWLAAVRAGQADLHRGLDIGVPSLVLRSARSVFATKYKPAVDTADTVLDTKQIAQYSGCLGNRLTVVPIDDARHDVFLSNKSARTTAFHELDAWLTPWEAQL